MDTHGVSSVEVVSGLVRQDNFVPSRRFREDDRENLQSCQRGGGVPEQILLALSPWRNKNEAW